MSNVNGVYKSKIGYQPICAGVNQKGELIWELRMKEPWHQKMFPVTYKGDFGEQWMWKSVQEKGLDWEGN